MFRIVCYSISRYFHHRRAHNNKKTHTTHAERNAMGVYGVFYCPRPRSQRRSVLGWIGTLEVRKRAQSTRDKITIRIIFVRTSNARHVDDDASVNGHRHVLASNIVNSYTNCWMLSPTCHCIRLRALVMSIIFTASYVIWMRTPVTKPVYIAHFMF